MSRYHIFWVTPLYKERAVSTCHPSQQRYHMNVDKVMEAVILTIPTYFAECSYWTNVVEDRAIPSKHEWLA